MISTNIIKLSRKEQIGNIDIITYFLKMTKVSKKINYKKFENKLQQLYPTLSSKEVENIIKQLFSFWWEMIENIDKLKK